jgi:hypothetical protein
MTFRKTAGNFVFNIAKKAFKKDSTPEVIDKVSISKNLKKFQENKEEIIKNTDKYTKGLTQEGKTKVRKSVAPALGKLSKLTQQFPEKKAKGGRVGLKKGSFPDLSGDGKTTMKDILIGRGVIKNKKKKFQSPMAKAVKKKNKKKII